MKPIYTPSGKAKEYGDYAINIYTGCPHRCYYCFAPSVLRRDREIFHTHVEPRPGIVAAVKRQLEKEQITDKIIHLCFTCDPYPNGHYSCLTTREIIRAIKEYGNHVQILTKGNTAPFDFDLLDSEDWFGVTLTGASAEQEPYASCPDDRLFMLAMAKSNGIKTWVSFEPVINAEQIYGYIDKHDKLFDKVKIGKLNYHPSDIDWKAFGNKCEQMCKERGLDYYIKDGLRAEMDKS